NAADRGDHRVADILHPLAEPMRLDPLEAGVTKVNLAEVRVSLAIELPPDRDRFCPKAPVREADDERRPGPQRPLIPVGGASPILARFIRLDLDANMAKPAPPPRGRRPPPRSSGRKRPRPPPPACAFQPA